MKPFQRKHIATLPSHWFHIDSSWHHYTEEEDDSDYENILECDEDTSLRFPLGTRVECCMGDESGNSTWEPGTVVRHGYEYNDQAGEAATHQGDTSG